MNYIAKLQAENEQLKQKIKLVEELVIGYQVYYTSEKFASKENDYAHVSTDVLPRLEQIKYELR